MTKNAKKSPEDDDFMAILEQGVRDVLKSPDAKPAERMSAIAAGSKLLMIRHRISGNDEKGFFD